MLQKYRICRSCSVLKSLCICKYRSGAKEEKVEAKGEMKKEGGEKEKFTLIKKPTVKNQEL